MNLGFFSAAGPLNEKIESEQSQRQAKVFRKRCADESPIKTEYDRNEKERSKNSSLPLDLLSGYENGYCTYQGKDHERKTQITTRKGVYGGQKPMEQGAPGPETAERAALIQA